MEVLDSLIVASEGPDRRIDLCEGDLTRLTPEFAVDVLVVSAFPGVYEGVFDSLIGGLRRIDVSVEELATHKGVDLRSSCSCWLSEPLRNAPAVGFSRILCFEPYARGASPPQVVGDIFRSLVPFLAGPEGIKSVAMPLVATGNAGVPVRKMLPPLLESAANWMALGLGLERLIIAIYEERDLSEAQETFAEAKLELGQAPPTERSGGYTYDVFLSYAHEDADEADLVESFLLERKGDLRIFRDVGELDPGSAWQQRIYEAIDDCHRLLPLYTPAYLKSDICKEEVNLAILRNRKSEGNLLFPIYLKTSDLPSYLAFTQYVDCRETEEKKLRAACGDLVASLRR